MNSGGDTPEAREVVQATQNPGIIVSDYNFMVIVAYTALWGKQKEIVIAVRNVS